MNLSQITAFEAVMTSPSLSDAARKLGRTQPAVSAAIKNLEDQLGLRLFRREGRKLVPVPEAQYLLTETRAILGRMAQVRRTMKSLTDGQAGTLNVAAMPGPVAMLFPKFLASQIDQSMDITVSILARSSVQIAELARAQSIDFGFADAPAKPEVQSLYSMEVISAKCFAAVPSEHPLAERAQVCIDDLSGHPMGSLQANHPHQRDVIESFRSRGLEFVQKIESQTFLPILQFVAARQSCAIIDPLTVLHTQSAGGSLEGIEIRPLVDEIRYRYAIFKPRHRPESILAGTLRRAWRQEVTDRLNAIGAAPDNEADSPECY